MTRTCKYLFMLFKYIYFLVAGCHTSAPPLPWAQRSGHPVPDPGCEGWPPAGSPVTPGRSSSGWAGRGLSQTGNNWG